MSITHVLVINFWQILHILLVFPVLNFILQITAAKIAKGDQNK